MTLRITNIKLRNFRSYDEWALDGLGDLTILVGRNASGKTNAVEALQLLTAMTSFRNATAAELVRNSAANNSAASDCETEADVCEVAVDAIKAESAKSAVHNAAARIEAHIEGDSRELDVAMTIESGKRSYTLNGKKRRPKDLRGILPSVVFTPDDLSLVKGSDRNRRRELDVLGSQLNSNYWQLVRDFEKVLRHKNRLLKDGAPPELIAAVNELFAKVGSQLTAYRKSLLARIMPHVAKHHSAISNGEQLTARYINSEVEGCSQSCAPNDEAEECSQIEECLQPSARSSAQLHSQSHSSSHPQHGFSVILESLLNKELSRGRALVGPHLDRIEFAINGMDASKFASQGQQRSIVLALKLSEAEIIEEMLDQLPVLLLDDVMSELDAARREALVETLLQGKQTFITTANIDYFNSDMLSRARIVNLSA